MDTIRIESRITGALLGLACGDALGAPAEFHDQAYVKSTWGTLTEMVGGGPWNPGEWTDDTGMALCLAEAILENPEDPIDGAGKRFLEWRKTAKDVGTTIGAALRAYQGDWPAAAQSTPQAEAGKAAGNGSLMRTLTVALAYGTDRATMLPMAARLSAMTHWDGEAEMCCLLYCLWIENLLTGQEIRSAWQDALRHGRQEMGRSQGSDTAGTGSLSPAFWTRLENIETLTYAGLQPSGYAGYVVECLEAAAWCCLHSSSLEEALVQAVNLAGEADTIAAVAGGVAGAFWGVEAIPERWLEKLYRREDLEATAKQLLVLRIHNQTYARPGLKPLNFDWVSERIMAGRNPLTSRDVQVLKALGITHFLDLREPHEWTAPKLGAEAIEEIQRLGLQRQSVAVGDTQAPMIRALDTAYLWLEDALKDENNRVYVHCRAGLERTAAVLIAYYARHNGVSYDETLSKLRKGRPVLSPLWGQEHAVRAWLQTGQPK